MAVVEINKENFEQIVSASGIVMVDCWASWCVACKDFGPVYERVADKHPNHAFGKLDTENEKEIVSALEIEHIPTLLLYRDGIMLLFQPGYFAEEKLEDIVDQAESVDMNAVRSHIQAEENRQSQEAG
ncbi:MAG: thioredoxin family protein [Gemmatimonadetes bacterium]|jgi:thioredoxin 1|nr:thioredoxin family protein [Gemmatimonadota bacterium]